MIGLLAKVLPLQFASSLSPGIFALAIVLLGSKTHPKIRVISLLIGTLIVGVLVAILGFVLGQSTPAGTHPSVASAIIDLTLAVLFLIFAFITLFSKDRSTKTHQEGHLWKWLIIGFVISVTNFDAVFLSFTAAKEISDAHSMEIVIQFILLIIGILFFIAPITLPLIIDLLFPKIALQFLSKINVFVLKYSKYILFAMFVIFAIVLAYSGIKYFL